MATNSYFPMLTIKSLIIYEFRGLVERIAHPDAIPRDLSFPSLAISR